MKRNVSQMTDHYYRILLTNFFIQAVEKQSASNKVEESMTNIVTTRMIPHIHLIRSTEKGSPRS